MNRKQRRRATPGLAAAQMADYRYTLMLYQAWVGKVPEELIAEVEKALFSLGTEATEHDAYEKIKEGVAAFTLLSQN